MWRVMVLFGSLAGALCLSEQHGFGQQLAAGDVLVANEKLADPNFAQSVILAVQYDSQDGTVGLIVNRRTDIPLSKIFPTVQHASGDPVYMGGPVETTAVLALLRLPRKTDQATAVVGDIYVTGAKELIEKSIGSRTESSKFRIYLGYAGWAAGQLEAEVRAGAWAVLHRRASVVFDDDPDSLWQRLTRESQMRMAKETGRQYALYKLLIGAGAGLRVGSVQ